MTHAYEVAIIDAHGKKFITRDRLRFSEAMALARIWGARIPRAPSSNLNEDNTSIVFPHRDERFQSVTITPIRKI
jgi:hypothetical protein